MKQKINVFTLEHLEECLKDSNYYKKKDEMDKSLSIIERFKDEYNIRKTDVITSLAFTIYLDKNSDNFLDNNINILKMLLKDVACKVDVETII